MLQQVSHHLLLCATPNKQKCCNSIEGIKSWEKLKFILKTLRLEDPSRSEGIVLRSKVDCLRICHSGPILLIWPEGIWYKQVSPERIESIVRKHIIKGEPIAHWILKETPMNNYTKSSISKFKKPPFNN